MSHGELQAKLDQMGLLPHRLAYWAEACPDKTFLRYGEEDRAYSYGEFNRMANCLANHLAALGVSKGDRVSLFLANPLVIVLSAFSLWKLGAVFCPINFSYRDRLLAYHLNDTAPVLLITESGCEPLLNALAGEISCRRVLVHEPGAGPLGGSGESAGAAPLHRAFERISLGELLEGEGHNPAVSLEPWDTANVVYTSGTTGRPKGVVQSHRWLQNYCYYGVRMLHPDDVVYCDLPLYHIGGAFSLVGRAAWAGCGVSLWDRFSASRFWDRIRSTGATYTLLLDVVIPRLLKHEPTPADPMNTLRRVHMQPLPEYHHDFCRRFGIDFVNVGYGATEIGYACAALIDEAPGGGGTPEEFRKGYSREELLAIARELGMPVVPGDRPLPKGYMGTPCMFHELAVVGEHDERLGPGEYGQIALRPKLPSVLLDEYFKKPEATAAAFRNLWFHTGDGARQDEDGSCYFVDRVGGFIRVRGENVSSFQVEDLLNAHPKVRLAAAFPVPASEGLEDDIVAYVVPVEGAVLEEGDVRDWMRSVAPKYMWPKHVVVADALPQTPTHKIEKYKLKESFLAERAPGQGR
ncbi:MAG: AMP-binding protein [Deltaproteobacteria bacterium]|nr:AMP-binding protein [Deltaproteobacteria bacterium]